MGVARHGSLLFLRPKGVDFEGVCNTFHGLRESSSKPLGCSHFSSCHRWVSEGNTLATIHKRARKTLFTPEGTKDRPAAATELAGERVTHSEYEAGTKAELVDNWHTAEDPRAKLDKPFVGKTETYTQTVHFAGTKGMHRSLSLVHFRDWRNFQRRYSHRRNLHLRRSETLSATTCARPLEAPWRPTRPQSWSNFVKLTRLQTNLMTMTCVSNFHLSGYEFTMFHGKLCLFQFVR